MHLCFFAFFPDVSHIIKKRTQNQFVWKRLCWLHRFDQQLYSFGKQKLHRGILGFQRRIKENGAKFLNDKKRSRTSKKNLDLMEPWKSAKKNICIHCSEFIVITKSNPKPFFPIVQSVFGTWVLYTKLIWGPCRYFLASTAMPINHTLTKL